MSSSETPLVSADEVLRRIRAELAQPSDQSSPLFARLAQLRAMQREFRNEPVGGRLATAKRLVYWFSASAFDRQGKVIEALFDLVDEMALELDQMQRLIVQLGSEREDGS